MEPLRLRELEKAHEADAVVRAIRAGVTPNDWARPYSANGKHVNERQDPALTTDG